MYLSNTSYPADACIDNLKTFLFLFLQIIALLLQKYPFVAIWQGESVKNRLFYVRY